MGILDGLFYLPVYRDGTLVVNAPQPLELSDDFTVVTERGRTLVSLALDRSIFSMLPPIGDQTDPAAPVCAYDFTCADLTDTAANNTTAANISGNSAFNLVIPGGGTVSYSWAFATLGSRGIYSPVPAGRRPESYGTCLVTDGTVGNEVDSAAGTALAITGALTVEWCGSINTVTGTVSLFEYSGAATDDLAENFLYRLAYDATAGKFTYFAEAGTGNNNIAADVSPVTTQWSPAGKGHHMFTLARNASGHVQLFIDGAAVCPLTVPVHQSGGSLVPNGGTNAKLKVNATVAGQCLAVRIFDYMLSPAQIQESYRETFYGK